MATITEPMALDKTFNTTETTPRNMADVLAEMGEAIAQGMGRQANEVSYDNTTSGLAADDVQEAIDELAAEKVDKVTGKGLSTNDYTDAEKTKLAGIAEGAEVNVQSDWAQTDSGADDYIKNKQLVTEPIEELQNDVESTQTVSGNPLTLTDCAPINAESLVVEFEPKQDLHGQSAPYVGGAGKNKLNLANDFSITCEANIIENYTIAENVQVNANQTYTISCYQNNAITSATRLTIQILGINGSNMYESDLLTPDLSAHTHKITFTPNSDQTVSFKIWAHTLSSQCLMTNFQLEYGDEATSWAPYENICPITGYTGVEVGDVGKNLLNINRESSTPYPNSFEPTTSPRVMDTEHYFRGLSYSNYYDTSRAHTVSISDGVLTFTGRSDYGVGFPIEVESGTSYVGSLEIISGSNIKINAAFYDKEWKYISGSYSANFTTPQNTKYAVIIIAVSGSTATTISVKNVQLEKGTQATDYEPFKSTSASIQFGQTVYGGKSDFSGGGTSDEIAHRDLGDLTYNYDSNNTQFYSNVIDDVASGGWRINGVATSCYKVDVKGYSELSEDHCRGFYDKRLYIIDTRYTNPSDLKTALAGQDLVYPKATPTQLSTPPSPLKLLKGTNNLTTNGTTIQLGYQPDNVIGEVKGDIEKHLEMPYLRILDNSVDTPINNYRIYFHMIASAYTLVNMAEMLKHRFILVELIQNPSGTANHNLLHSALIDPRTIDGFSYIMSASGSNELVIESDLAQGKFSLYLLTTGGSYSDGDPTDYYVTIRLVD